MFVLINQPPEPPAEVSQGDPRRGIVVWNRPSSKSWVSCLVALGRTGAASGHTLIVANLNPGKSVFKKFEHTFMKKFGKCCSHLGNFWFTSVGIIKESSGALVPPMITVWPTSVLGEVVQGLVPLSFETPGCTYHHFPGQRIPVLDHPPS